MDRTDPQLVTPREAARIAGCGRSSIMRALASRALPATRDNRNSWLIRREDLDRWSGARIVAGPVTDRPMPEPVTGHGPDHEEGITHLAAAEARAEALADQVKDLRAERDRLLALVERLSERQPSEVRTEARPSFLARLLGRGQVRAA